MGRHIVVWLIVALAAAPMCAADVDANLPGNTEVVVSINLEQLLASPLGKRYLRTTVEEALKANPQGQEAFKFLELDPLRDLKQVTLALPSAGADAGCLIVKGKFNRQKIAELAEKLVVEQKEKLRIHKSGRASIYEIAGDKPTFVAVPDDSTALIATTREQLTAGAKPKKEVTDLIQKADGKQALWLVALGSATSVIPGGDAAQRQAFEKIEGIIGVLKVTTSAKLELTLAAQDPAAATAVGKNITEFLSTAKAFAPEAVKQNPPLAPIFELLGGAAMSVKDKSVTVTAEASAAQIEKWVKQFGAEK